MPRTTLNLDDDILVCLKQRAAAEGTALQSVANALLRQALYRQTSRPPFTLKLETWKAELQPGVDIQNRDDVFRLMDEET